METKSKLVLAGVFGTIVLLVGGLFLFSKANEPERSWCERVDKAELEITLDEVPASVAVKRWNLEEDDGGGQGAAIRDLSNRFTDDRVLASYIRQEYMSCDH